MSPSKFSSSEQIVVNSSEEGRLDRFLADRMENRSRSYIRKLIDTGHITVNCRNVKPSCKIQQGDEILITFPCPEPLDVEAEDIPLDVLYEDADLIAVSKIAGMVMHPGAGVVQGTLVNALLHHCKDLSGIGGKLRPGIVHRLDKGTSGVIVAAKNDYSHERIARQFSQRETKKIYYMLVAGIPPWTEQTVDEPIARHPSNRKKMSVQDNGRPAVTKFKVLGFGNNISLIGASPLTGRTHQIRVHIKQLNYAICGDDVYGTNWIKRLDQKKISDRIRKYPGICLHARQLTLLHPRTGKTLTLSAALPEIFNWVILEEGIEAADRGVF